MGRQSTMIPMNGLLFKNAVQKRQSLASLEGCLGVKRQAINGWISNNKIPPRKLTTLIKELGLSPNEIEQITKQLVSKSQLLFRTCRNTDVNPETEKQILSIADDYFRLNKIFALDEENINISISDDNPVQVAQSILRILDLKSENLNFKQAVNALKQYNINVLFCDLQEPKAQAVCVSRGAQNVIMISRAELIEDITWRLFHEVCHIFCNHEESTKKVEDFCNAVATEIVTPSSFFERNHSNLKSKFSGPLSKEHILWIEEIMNRFGAGFVGIILRLKEFKIISSATNKHLWQIWWQKRKPVSPTIDALFAVPAEVDTVEHWTDILTSTDKSNYLRFQSLIVRAVVLEKLSLDRASELLKLDIKTTQEIAEVWKSRVDVEVSDEAHN